MRQKTTLTEQAMRTMEACIPELAGNAVKRAYYQALTTSGKVLEAVNGELVETSAEGSFRVIRHLSAPTPIIPGSKRLRTRKP